MKIPNPSPSSTPPDPVSLFSEKHLQALWLEQKYFLPLQTSEGLTIQVISPGMWNSEAGPDFLNAHIRIGNRDLRGDIELHLREEGWFQHGHHLNENYNRVILHVSLWPAAAKSAIKNKNGDPIPHISLLHYLAHSAAHLLKLIDLDLYPYTRFSGTGRCAEELFKTLSENEIKKALRAAAYWRLEKKYEYLSSQFENDPIQQMLSGIALALGYKHNAEQFIEIFRFLYPMRDYPFPSLLSIALGICSFFEKDKRRSWDNSEYYQNLSHHWGQHQTEVIHQANLRLDHIRPLNHPIRRLVYLVYLLQDPTIEHIWGKMVQTWKSGYESLQEDKPSFLMLQFLDLIPNYQDSYWNTHYLFEQAEDNSSGQHLVLMGQNLKKKIIINTFLPLLYKQIKERKDAFELEQFDLFYSRFKSEPSSKKRYLHHRFFGSLRDESILNLSIMEQGAFQIHKDFCIHFEASCHGCPFVTRYFESQSTARSAFCYSNDTPIAMKAP